LLLHEPIADEFHTRLRARMDKLRIGDPLDKNTDVGAIVDPVQLRSIQAKLDGHSGGTRHVCSAPLPELGCFYPPTLIQGLAPSDPLMQEEIFGPVLVSTTFRTPAEAVQLANNTRYGLAASVWSENINLALDIAPRLASGIVWVNATNLMDAAAGFGGVRESGFGREGGWEGLRAYTKDRKRRPLLKPVDPATGIRTGAQTGPAGLDRTAKLYIGGKQTRPDGGYSEPVHARNGALLGHVALAGRKDVRGAVEAAHAAAGWSRTTGHLRAQILYYIAENLELRGDEIARRLNAVQGGKSGAAQVGKSIERLFTYAAWADKYEGRVHGVPLRGVAMGLPEAIGVIGVICPDEAPLLGLVSCMAPAIAMGNRVILAASQTNPLAAADLIQVLETSDVPAGVVNILTGPHADLAPTLSGHMDVDAVWSFGAADLSATVEAGSASNLKRTWVNNGLARDWMGTDGEGRAFLQAATETKTVWIPYGE
jgi:aldehyde dehydrogenase (NAD+)